MITKTFAPFPGVKVFTIMGAGRRVLMEVPGSSVISRILVKVTG
jgi:hypothetical protein